MAALFSSVEKLMRLSPATKFAQSVYKAAVFQEIAEKSLIIFGEEHAMAPVVQFQVEVIKEIVRTSNGKKLNVIMEHFSFEMQTLLDQYVQGDLDLAGLITSYKEIGTEGHNIQAYAGCARGGTAAQRRGGAPRGLHSTNICEAPRAGGDRGGSEGGTREGLRARRRNVQGL